MSTNSTPSSRRDLLLQIVCCQPGWLRHDEPVFRNWERLSQSFRDEMKELKSSDIENDSRGLDGWYK